MYVDTKNVINRKIIKIIVKNKMMPINRGNIKYYSFTLLCIYFFNFTTILQN